MENGVVMLTDGNVDNNRNQNQTETTLPTKRRWNWLTRGDFTFLTTICLAYKMFGTYGMLLKCKVADGG